MSDYDEITCRLCLQPVEQAYLMCTICDDDISLSDKICMLFSIEADEFSPAIETVCHECVETVCNFYAYYQKVRSNNEQLKATREESGEKTTVEITAYDEDDGELETVYFFPNKVEDLQSSSAAPDIEILEEEDSQLVASPAFQEVSESYKSTEKTDICLDLPEHLKQRISKAKGDAKIREFIDMTCTVCGPEQSFDTFKNMQIHYEKEHNTRGFITCCGKKIYRKDRAMDHIALHMNPNAYECPVCGHSSKSRVLLRIHMKQHLPSEEWPFECEKCNQRFVLKSQLTNHEATHLNTDQKKFVCDECGKVFALKFVLIKHKLTHSKEKKFFCEVCAKSFSSQSTFNSHMKQHDTNAKPTPRVQCRDCGQWYKNIQTLRTHEHRHRDTRLHICETCNRKCSSKSSLSAHIRYVHKKTSEYECNICTKRFRRKPELAEHMARHTGQVLYTCSYCPKTFYSSSNFFAHRKTKHPTEYSGIIRNTSASGP